MTAAMSATRKKAAASEVRAWRRRRPSSSRRRLGTEEATLFGRRPENPQGPAHAARMQQGTRSGSGRRRARTTPSKPNLQRGACHPARRSRGALLTFSLWSLLLCVQVYLCLLPTSCAQQPGGLAGPPPAPDQRRWDRKACVLAAPCGLTDSKSRDGAGAQLCTAGSRRLLLT